MIIKTNKEKIREYNSLIIECIQLIQQLPDVDNNQANFYNIVCYAPIRNAFNVYGVGDLKNGHVIHAPMNNLLEVKNEVRLRKGEVIAVSPMPSFSDIMLRSDHIYGHTVFFESSGFDTYSNMLISKSIDVYYNSYINTAGQIDSTTDLQVTDIIVNNHSSDNDDTSQRITGQMCVNAGFRSRTGRKLSELIHYIGLYNELTIEDLAFKD